MNKLVFIKIGGSLLTDKTTPYKLRESFIEKLADVLPQKTTNQADVIIGTGAGSFGHFEAKKNNLDGNITSHDQIRGACKTHLGVQKLSQIVAQKLSDTGWSAFTFSPSAFMTSCDNQISGLFVEPINIALSNKMTPVVHGETVLDKNNKIRIFSTEAVAFAILPELQKHYDKILTIFLTNIDGVMDTDGKIIPHISSNLGIDKLGFFHNNNYDVTDGMRKKVEICQDLTRCGIEAIIANGQQPDVISRILSGEKIGTGFY